MKIMRIISAVIFDILTLFWCGVFLENIIYSVTRISTDKGSVGIIGGADFPTLLFILQTNGFIQIFFILASIAAGVSLTISAFQKSTLKHIRIILTGLISVAALLFLLIPPQSYAVSLYTVLRKIPFFKYVNLIYFLIAAINILLTLLKSTGENQCKTDIRKGKNEIK